jgi:hypothetical protein
VQEQPPGQKKAFLLNQYVASLGQAGFRYTLVFEMVDEGGHSLFLLFGTSHERGLHVMKDAMWKVDPFSGVRYRDPRHEGQLLLDLKLEPDTQPLQETIVDHLATSGPNTVDGLRRLALLNTVYRPEHVRTALRSLIRENRVCAASRTDRLTATTVIELSPTRRQRLLF